DSNFSTNRYLSPLIREAEKIGLPAASMEMLPLLLSHPAISETRMREIKLLPQRHSSRAVNWCLLQLAAASLRAAARADPEISSPGGRSSEGKLWSTAYKNIDDLFGDATTCNEALTKPLIKSFVSALSMREREALYLVVAADDGLQLSSLG